MAGPKTTFGDTTHLMVYSSSNSEGAHFPSRIHTYHVTMWLTKWLVENGWVIMTGTVLCQKRSQVPTQYQHIPVVARAVRKGTQQLTLAKVWSGSAWQTSVTLVCSYALPLYKDWVLDTAKEGWSEHKGRSSQLPLSVWWFRLQTWPSRLELCIEWSMIMTCLSFPQSQCFLCSVHAETRQSQWSQLKVLSTEMYTACHWRISHFDNYTWHPTWNRWHGYMEWYQSMPLWQPALGNCIWSTATICICYKDR